MTDGKKNTAEVRRFVSAQHPQGAPAALVYGRALASPLAACVVPIMLLTLAAALQGRFLTLYLYGGLPAALLLAVAWTRLRLARTPAEVRVRSDAAALRTVYDCARGRPPRWKRVFDLRQAPASVEVAIGRDTYELRHTDWPEHEALLAALRRARYAPYAATSHAAA